jgi:hypothetical protein
VNTEEQVGPEAVLRWVRDAMALDRAPEAMGRARLTLTYIAPDGTERVTDVPMLDLSRDNAVATIQHTREMYHEDYPSPYAGVALRPTPVNDWYSVLIHAPVRPTDGEHAWTETTTDPVLAFLSKQRDEYAADEGRIEDWESAGYVIRRLMELRQEEIGWPTTPST